MNSNGYKLGEKSRGRTTYVRDGCKSVHSHEYFGFEFCFTPLHQGLTSLANICRTLGIYNLIPMVSNTLVRIKLINNE